MSVPTKPIRFDGEVVPRVLPALVQPHADAGQVERHHRVAGRDVHAAGEVVELRSAARLSRSAA